MSEREFLELSEKLDYGLKLSYEKMLRQKALLGETVIISDGKGNPVEVSAQELLQKYLETNHE